MSIYQREGSPVWYIYIRHDGERVRRSTHTDDKRKAQEIHDQVKADLWRRKTQGHTLADALKLWLKTAERSRNEKNALRQFLKLYPSRPLSEITGHAINDALLDKAASTANRTTNIIRAALNMAADRGWCNPIKIPKRKEASQGTRFLTQTEWIRLESQLPQHVKVMAQFSVSTGLRQANVFGLMWSAVDMDRAVAWVDSMDSKSGKPIPVPLSAYAMRILEAQKGIHPEYVFTYRGRKVGSVKTAWNKAVIRAGVAPLRWHDLRHTWASWHVMKGTPLRVLKELGGWHSMELVMRYAHLSPDHIKQWADNAVA